MTSMAQPINFPSSRPTYRRSGSVEVSSPSSSPRSSSLELGTSPTQQHPCPHLNQFVQSLVKAYWGPNTSTNTNGTPRR
ncbi:hypothetical protein I302_102757 [Kwoniella bestiolae CBS 10118]|uniref:Uncharacterized protein n=1 Tax=Kwoniella bestiolae CBS 10118 TaxID=1296100 RepID=A0A1B9GFZ7_9TREE|nr:hypothetical protein I302_01450 [Kwoniella bestiolae CBS 10118]OCF29937.1 hypothetical protein I302_01450 [Kwoniella bestiolae CBS 10118]